MKQNLLAALVLSLALTASAEAFHKPCDACGPGKFYGRGDGCDGTGNAR